MTSVIAELNFLLSLNSFKSKQTHGAGGYSQGYSEHSPVEVNPGRQSLCVYWSPSACPFLLFFASCPPLSLACLVHALPAFSCLPAYLLLCLPTPFFCSVCVCVVCIHDPFCSVAKFFYLIYIMDVFPFSS